MTRNLPSYIRMRKARMWVKRDASEISYFRETAHVTFAVGTVPNGVCTVIVVE